MLLMNFSIGSNYIVQDCVSANNVAIVKVVYPNLLDADCFSIATLDLINYHFKLSNLTEFLNYLLLLFSHNYLANVKTLMILWILLLKVVEKFLKYVPYLYEQQLLIVQLQSAAVECVL